MQILQHLKLRGLVLSHILSLARLPFAGVCAQRASFAAAAPSSHWDKFVKKGDAADSANTSAKIPEQPVVAAAASVSADAGIVLEYCFV
jgi:predicted lipid-binding transport protein (Tim44 family)